MWRIDNLFNYLLFRNLIGNARSFLLKIKTKICIFSANGRFIILENSLCKSRKNLDQTHFQDLTIQLLCY